MTNISIGRARTVELVDNKVDFVTGYYIFFGIADSLTGWNKGVVWVEVDTPGIWEPFYGNFSEEDMREDRGIFLWLVL